MPFCEKIEGRFYQDYIIPEYAFDKNNDIRVSELQKMTQDTSSKHLAEVGYDYDTLAKSGYVYLLAYSKIKSYKKTKAWENLRVYVWPKSSKGARSYRDIIFIDRNKELVAEVSTVWVLADSINHKIVPPDNTPVILKKIDDMPLKIKDAKKIKMPKNMEKVGVRQVVYTDLDPNNHMNNSVYSDVFMDFATDEMDRLCLEEFEINYRNEALLDDSIIIFRAEIESKEGKDIFIKGMIGDRPCFDTVGKFKNR